jgi:hypothetical protein
LHGKFRWKGLLKVGTRYVLELAIGKLMGGRAAELHAPIHRLGDYNGKIPAYDKNWTNEELGRFRDPAFAALSTRIMIDVEPRRQAGRALESALVHSHLRTVYSVPQHREYMRTGTPSEPILAEAAAVLQHEIGIPPLTFLQYILENNLVGKGERGDLVVRTLLVMAMDSAIHKQNTKASPDRVLAQFYEENQTFYHRFVPVNDYIEALISAGVVETIFGAYPENRAAEGSKTFKEALKNAFVCFTHFTRLDKPADMTSDMMLLAFSRGAALQCSAFNPLVDVAIPVAICPDAEYWETSLSKAHFSSLLFSIKNRLKPVGANYTINPDNYRFWGSRESDPDIPVATFVLDTGIFRPTQSSPAAQAPDQSPLGPGEVGPQTPGLETAPEKKSTAQKQPMTPSKIRARSEPTKQMPRTQVRDHIRYHFAIRGCSPTVYRVITEADQDVYRNILAAGRLFEEYPMIDHPDFLSTLQAAKPTLSYSAACWNYTDSVSFPEPTASDPANDDVVAFENVDED